jgi:hypothetical protein
MIESARNNRNSSRFKELYPTFANRLSRVIIEMENRGYRPRIQDGYRSPADQLVAFRARHSKLKYGFHNVTGANGTKESLAVDLLDDDFPLNSRKEYLLNLADVCSRHGLITGIKWGLSDSLKKGIDETIRNKNWTANVKIGWDPTHVQPIGISVAGAKNGRRPS